MGNKHGKIKGFGLTKNQPSTIKPLPTAKDSLLVHGYIRKNEQVLESFYILPLTIYQWIFRYFQSKNTLYWTSPQHIYSVSIEKDDTKDRVNAVIKMNQCYCPAVCYGSNVHLPIDLIKTKAQQHTKYNAIFKCGGIANDRALLSKCSATILAPPPIHKTDEELITNISLPLLPRRVASNCVVFSNNYGLLSIGGFVGTYNNWNSLPRQYISNVYRLEFNGKYGAKWEWQQLTLMRECRGYASAQIINKFNSEKLIVIGGDLQIGNIYSNSAEIYDFERNEWKYIRSMKHGRICSGVHYDANINCIYVGGGYCDSRIEMYSNFRKVELYNCIKNKWYPFPDTKLKHAFYPFLWKHNNLLFIASAYSTGLEYIDLRIGMSWNAVYGEKNKKKKKFWHLFKKRPFNNAASGAICSGRLIG